MAEKRVYGIICVRCGEEFSARADSRGNQLTDNICSRCLGKPPEGGRRDERKSERPEGRIGGGE